jgi:hypothetical protein
MPRAIRQGGLDAGSGQMDPEYPRGWIICKRRVARGRGYCSSVMRTKSLYGPSNPYWGRRAMLTDRSGSTASATVSRCTPSSAAMVPIFQCSA